MITPKAPASHAPTILEPSRGSDIWSREPIVGLGSGASQAPTDWVMSVHVEVLLCTTKQAGLVSIVLY